MMTRRAWAGSAAAVSSAGCQRSRRRVIGVVPKATSHLFFVSINLGVRNAAHEFGVDVTWNGPNDETDHNRQIQIVDSLIAQRVDALAISATDERALTAPVERAIAAGIPVTVFDSGVKTAKYVTFVATDNAGAGATAARRLAALVQRPTVAMVMQKPGGTSTGERERNFEETITREFPALRIVTRQYCMADRARALAAAENILTAHPDVGGIFCSSEAASLGAIQAITTRGVSGTVKLVTFDTSEAHVAALGSGLIDVMLVQDGVRIGYEAVASLVRKLRGETPSRRVALPAREVVRADLGKPDVLRLLRPIQ
ncbi:MAG: substrate-binding domain-containing protein [Acidobacteria bacterium]|nr:substrate-binding domain-containing protein [Acidobacteriota bacterium]